MAFQDIPMKAGKSGLSVSGLELSKIAAMTLELTAGTVTLHRTGVAYTLSADQNHAFSPDPTLQTRVFMGLVENGANVDLWVDSYVDDGETAQGDPPSGYKLVLDVAWFTIAAAETDLANTTINRRTWI